jgi:hypothetical protein
LGIERENQRQVRRQERLAKGYPNVIAKARRYETALAEPGETYRTVVERFRVTREEVCQYMVVLTRLPDALRTVVEQETDPSRLRTLSLRQLLRIARLPSLSAKRLAFASLGASTLS